MKKMISILLASLLLSSCITVSAYYDTASGKLTELSNKTNPATYSYTASENEIVCFGGNVWTDAILHIEAYSDSKFEKKITEDCTTVPDGNWASALTPHIYVKLDADETVYIKAYADNPGDKTIDLDNVTIVVGVNKCIDLSNAEIELPTSINEYGWKIFKDAFVVKVNGETIGPGDYEIICDGKNVEGKHLNAGKQTITISGIWSGLGSKDAEIEVGEINTAKSNDKLSVVPMLTNLYTENSIMTLNLTNLQRSTDNSKKYREKQIVVNVSKGDLKSSTVKLSKDSYLYDGKAHFPSVILENTIDGVLKENEDYKITYSGESKNVGKYSVTITGTGNYQGEITKYYSILPNATGDKSESFYGDNDKGSAESSTTTESSNITEPSNTAETSTTAKSENMIVDDDKNVSKGNNKSHSFFLIIVITAIVLAALTILTGIYIYRKRKRK